MRIEQSRADGQSMLVKQDPYNQARRQRSERSFPRLLGADARRHQVAANESADEIGKDVSCPNHQQDETHSSDQTSAWRQQQRKMAKGLLRSPRCKQRPRSKLAAWHRLHSAPAAEKTMPQKYRLAIALE